jgi:nucleotide-binding universal stress UspA family protein
MKGISKILIAYDGSACADAALIDLRRAGLPAAVEAAVITVADVILPPSEDEVPERELLPIHIPEGIRRAQAHAEEAVKEAQALAERATERLKADFPSWEVKMEACGDSPAWAVIKMAEHLKSDLIVVGSHGHSTVGGRLILGSVSQRVLYETRCSVRVARCWEARGDGPVRIIVGFNGSPDAELAVDAVASRAWPEGSEARIVTALETKTLVEHDVPADKLRAAGLTISNLINEGNPAHVLIEEAEKWGADSIFVGTRDVHGFKHFLTGSVSSAVAARATCSVEVVRQG